MVLAVGYRVRSNVGIHFRRWASGILIEHMKKGFVLNDERLRNPKEFGADYFEELLERVRDIRASEKRLYRKARIFFLCPWIMTARAKLRRIFQVGAEQPRYTDLSKAELNDSTACGSNSLGGAVASSHPLIYSSRIKMIKLLLTIDQKGDIL